MTYRLLSMVEPAPPGFSMVAPESLDLLAGALALYTREPEAVLALAGDRREQLCGVLLCPGDHFQSRQLHTRLWRYEVPEAMLPAAQLWLPPLLLSLGREAMLEQLIEQMPINTVVYDEQDSILLCSTQAAHKFGRPSVSALAGTPIEAFFPGDAERQAMLRYLNAEVRGSGEPVEVSSLAPVFPGETDRRYHSIRLPVNIHGRSLVISVVMDITTHREHEQKLQELNTCLRQREADLHRVIALMPLDVFVYDENDHILLCSDAGAHKFGQRSGRAVEGKSLDELFSQDPDRGQWIRRLNAQLRASGGLDRYTDIRIFSDVVGRLYEVARVPLPLGQQTAIMAVGMDITERVRYEQELQKLNARLHAQEAELRQIIDMMPQDIVVYDEQDRIMIGNAAAAKNLGQLTAQMLVGRSVDELFGHDPVRAQQIRQANADIRHGWKQNVYSTEHPVHVSNGPGSFEVTKMPMRIHDQTGVLTVVMDVTERRNHEKVLQKLNARLRQQEAQLRQIIDVIPQNIVVYDERDNIVLGNASALRFLRITSPDAVVGQPIKRLLDFDPLLAEDARRTNAQVRATLKPTQYSVTTEEDGQTHYYHIIKMPVPAGDHVWVLLVSTDITERHQQELELQRLNSALEARVEERTAQLEVARQLAEAANRAKSLFLATMSHEIRTPMNGVIGLLELLRYSELGDDQANMANTIHESAINLLTILDDILDFSKIEAGRLNLELTPLDLGQLAQGIVDTLQRTAKLKRLQLSSDIDPKLPRQLLGDPVRIRQVLVNLISNALKFTETTPGHVGEVRLTLHFETAGADTATVLICVRDNGIGMSDAAQALLFQPFTQAESSITRRFGGTGLGLSICQRLIGLMGGNITVNSQPGQGTEFQVRLHLPYVASAAMPQLSPPRPERRACPELAAAEARGQLVLVAEDNPVNQQVIRRQLEWLGYACLMVADGQEALQVWRKHRIGLLITDCHMPIMDGYALAARLRAQEATRPGARTPIIALSANALAGEAERCRHAGMDDYLAKPVELASLQSVLAKWLPA